MPAFDFRFSLTLFFGLIAHAGQGQVQVEHQKDSLRISLQGSVIFKGAVSAQRPCRVVHQNTLSDGAALDIITISSDLATTFELHGNVVTHGGALTVESDPRDNGLKVIRHAVGPSHSLLNNAVYDVAADWLFSIDAFYPRINITADTSARNFSITAKGWEVVIRIRPEYYRKHRGLSYFDPAALSLFKKPIVGWCSWFAYFGNVTEKDIREVTDVVAQKLKPWGLTYLQIDDGYQQKPIGLVDHWLTGNKKFPGGLPRMAQYISQHGLTPGIWTNVSFADSAAAFQNKSLFVRDEKGVPVKGNWVDYVMDGSNPETISTFITPTYRGLKEQGWRYFKLDALRHLKYEGYNSYREYFEQKKANREEAFRNVVKAVRASIGPELPLMACWGIRQELVGVVDACRIGNDGYSYAGLAQFNSYNNVVWRNDPDHIELSEKEAYRSCVATSLTGSLFMLTDKPEKYNSPLLEAAIRSIPVLYTRPGQVYDVDPSRSARIHWADAEMSGSGPRPFDASTSTTTGLFAQEINRPFEQWLVLGRLDERDPVLPLKDLGLADNKDYLVFEFWTKKFAGVSTKEFVPGPIDPHYNCQVFCFRERTSHPQLLATNRHITCGGVDLKKVTWQGKSLVGESSVVPVENYEIYVYEPASYGSPLVQCSRAKVVRSSKVGDVRTIVLHPDTDVTDITWRIQY